MAPTRRRLLRVLGGAATLPLADTAAGSPVESPLDANPWPERRVLDFAHQGGALEVPSDTLFALKTARAKGADVLEIDVHATADDEIVAMHDTTVDRTTDGSGAISELSLAELKELDAAYWFVEGCGACHDRDDREYEYRGYATGDRRLPPGLAAKHDIDSVEPNDFRVPTLREVLEAFPDTFLNVEIKRTAPRKAPYEEQVASLVREYDRTGDAIVVAFNDAAVERFKAHAPAVDTAVGTGGAAAFTAASRGPAPGSPVPDHVALQVPITYEGVRVVDEDFVADAHANDLAVHVWTVNDRETMGRLVDLGVDGIMTDRPTVLEEILAEEGVRFAPDG